MKKIKYIIFLFIVLVCALIIYDTYNYYAPPHLRDPYQMKKPDDTLQIAYIGDSWAFMHKDYDCQLAMLIENELHQPVKVYSHGICGLTSKEIYEKMYDDTEYYDFLQRKGYQYCFISAGINDTYKKMSTSYYKRSMDGIIQFFLANNIHLIILEIPDYDIQKAYNWQKSTRKLLRDASMFINNTPIDCKQMYRTALKALIIQKGYQNKVSIIRYESWNNDYDNNLQQLYLGDGMHLNSIGYSKLDSAIAREIIKLQINNDYEHENH